MKEKMMKTKQKTKVTGAVLLLFFSVVACSGKNKSAQGSENITLTIAAGTVGQELQTVKEQAVRYMEKHPNITVEVLDAPALSDDRLAFFNEVFADQSDQIDVMQIDVVWPGDLQKYLVDLNAYGANDYTEDHFPAIINNNTINGQLLAMPFFADGGMLFYRKDLLEAYGYTTPPQTWSKFEEIAKKVQVEERKANKNENFYGFVWQGKAYEGLTCDALEWISSNDGGNIVSRFGEVTIDNDNAVQALTRTKNWVGGISPKGVLDYAEEDTREIFQKGNAMFMRNWSYAYALLRSDNSPVKDKFAVIPLPHGKGRSSSTLGGWQLALSKYSKHPKEAAELIFFMTGKKEQKIRAITASFQPTIKSLYEDPEVLAVAPFFGTLYDSLVGAVARPSTITSPDYNKVSEIFFTNVHAVLSGTQSAKEALKDTATKIKEILQQ